MVVEACGRRGVRRRVGRSCLEWRVRLARGTRERRGRRAAMVRRGIQIDETMLMSIEVEVKYSTVWSSTSVRQKC